MAFTIERISLMHDDLHTPVDWNNDVIGLNVKNVNVQIEASGLDPNRMPANISIKVESHVPNKSSGKSTISNSLTWNIPHVNNTVFYQLSRSVNDIGFAISDDAIPEVTTIVREGGTSDKVFRSNLGWASRGYGEQPTGIDKKTNHLLNTADRSTDRPDALRLLQSGGVEVLIMSIVGNPDWKIRSRSVRRLIRNPANIIYYSGHGLWWNNSLGVECPNCPNNEDGYVSWAKASDLVDYWSGATDIEVFIIAGCSLLSIDIKPKDPHRPPAGLEFARLLNVKGGPLKALLGYQSTAPLDASGGDRVAEKMAKKIGSNSKDYVKDWLRIHIENKIRHADNAVGIDSIGFWWVDSDELRNHTYGRGTNPEQAIKGPRPIT